MAQIRAPRPSALVSPRLAARARASAGGASVVLIPSRNSLELGSATITTTRGGRGPRPQELTTADTIVSYDAYLFVAAPNDASVRRVDKKIDLTSVS
jgi:hypothetical protein